MADSHLWEEAARTILNGEITRDSVNLFVLARNSVPGRRAAQFEMSEGVSLLNPAELLHGERLFVLQRPSQPSPTEGRVYQCVHCAESHCTATFRVDSGRMDHPLRVFFIQWLLQTLSGSIDRGDPAHYTLSEIQAVAIFAKIRMVPVDVHYAQVVVTLASQLRLNYAETAVLHDILHSVCFKCGELRATAHILPTVVQTDAFALMTRAPPCTSLWLRGVVRWTVRRLSGVSVLFLAIARMVHESVSATTAGRDPVCVVSLTPGTAELLEPLMRTNRSSLVALYALFSLLRCYTPGCGIRPNRDNSPIPGLSDVVLRELEGDLADVETVAGTLAALYRFRLLSDSVTPEAVRSLLSASGRANRAFPHYSLLEFLGADIYPAVSDHAVWPKQPADNGRRLSLVVSFPVGSDQHRPIECRWGHALSPEASADETAITADNAVPALRAVPQGHGDASGLVDFSGLGLWSGSMNLDFVTAPGESVHSLRIDPGIFSMISRAPLLTFGGSRTLWDVAGPPRRVIFETILSVARYMGAVNRMVITRILFCCNISDFWSRVCAEDYVDWIFALATNMPDSHCHPIQFATADLGYQG